MVGLNSGEYVHHIGHCIRRDISTLLQENVDNCCRCNISISVEYAFLFFNQLVLHHYRLIPKARICRGVMAKRSIPDDVSAPDGEKKMHRIIDPSRLTTNTGQQVRLRAMPAKWHLQNRSPFFLITSIPKVLDFQRLNT